MRIIPVGIFTALAMSIASPSNNAATLERDSRAMATLDRKLLATKGEAVLDVDKEAKIAKEMPKRTRFLLQQLDNQALSTSFGLLRSVTSHFPAQARKKNKREKNCLRGQYILCIGK